MQFEKGKVFGKVSYPLLDIHRANQTYAYQDASYNLMNFIEFVSDQYVALNLQHSFNGFVEASVGVSNIFKLLRVDYVRRLNNLNHPNISKKGIRLSLKFDF